jgi:hypothetical protein
MSKLNCWRGCLAYVPRGPHYGELFSVTGWMGAYTFFGGTTAHDVWICRAEQPVTLKFKGVRRRQNFKAGEDILMRDVWLRPITPPPGSVTDSEVRELFSPRTVTPTPCHHKDRSRV